MPLTKISKNFQVTLPAGLRRDFDLKGGDYLEVTVKNGVFIFKPIKVVEITPSRTKQPTQIKQQKS
jgi:AbrB family looped-hinge helix DNA binding protein